LVVEARFREGWYIDALLLNQIAITQSGRGVYHGGEIGCVPGATTEQLRVTQGLLRGADGKLKASTWNADLSLPARDGTNPRYALVYYKGSDKTPALAYVSPSASPVLAHPATTSADYALASIYQPATGNGGLVVEDFRMNPSLDMAGLSENFQVIPASTRWSFNTAAGGAIQIVLGFITLFTSTGGSDYAAIQSRVSGNAVLQWNLTSNPLFYMRWVAKAQTSGMNAWLGFGIGGVAITEASAHVAVKVVGNNWYLSNHDGATESNVLLMADDHNFHVFEILRLLDDDDSGYKSVAYIDGVYKGQNRNNMPTGTLQLGAKVVGYNSYLLLRSLKLITQEE
jgi:hypothetical protein